MKMKDEIKRVIKEITNRKLILRIPSGQGISTFSFYKKDITIEIIENPYFFESAELGTEAAVIFNFISLTSAIKNFKACEYGKALFWEKYPTEFDKLRGTICSLGKTKE
jgi:hypothetical protein